MRSLATRSMAVHDADAVAGHAALARHLEQDGDARVGRVDAMTETRQPGVLLNGPVDGAGRGIVQADALAARLFDGVLDEDHAPFAGAAVIVTDGEDAGGNRRREGLAIPGGGQPRGRAGGSTRAVIGNADQDGIEELAFAGRRQAAAMQQENRLGEAAAHQRGHVVSADPDAGAVRMRDGGSPLFHGNPALSPKAGGRRSLLP